MARLLVVGIGVGVVAAAIAVAAGLFSTQAQPSNGQSEPAPNPNLSFVESSYLRTYIAANQAALSRSTGEDNSPISFNVTAGETAGDIADRLAKDGLISDTTLFRNYVRYYGYDTKIEAGNYQLSRRMTIPDLAVALTLAESPDLTVRFVEGWRREQMAALLDQQTDLPFHGAEFMAATSTVTPEHSDFAAANGIPGGAPLEGFLFPDTYRLTRDADASALVTKLIENFGRQFTSKMRDDAQVEGMTIFQVVTLASIVEREAVIDAERPLIASVYLNRLRQGMKLDADPTVQYAMGYQAATNQWWNLGLTQDDYQNTDSPYNTYLNPGLPPGPISNPGLASILAVVYPAKTDYLFFRAKCDGSGQHNFATTYQEHLANACP